jgi:hypothetical protein
MIPRQRTVRLRGAERRRWETALGTRHHLAPIAAVLHTGGMLVRLKFDIDCDADTAWRAIRSPAVLRAVSSPFIGFSSLEESGFPEQWSEGPHPVELRALGLYTLGEQVIDVSFSERKGARILHDSGLALTGPLSLITRWEHSIAVAPTGDGRTLYRDQLDFSAGLATAAVWPVYWAFWQWRGARIRALASSWT